MAFTQIHPEGAFYPSEYDSSRLREIDLRHLWHPFTQTSVWENEDAPIIERGEGVSLFDTDGKRYLDGISSIWCNVHGHGVPALVRAVQEQSERMCHSTLLGLTHRPVLELTERMLAILPRKLPRIFFSDSGSAAVEAALRMCLEWWHNTDGRSRGKAGTRRSRLLSLNTGYHGDTLGAVRVGYVESFHNALRSSVVPSVQIPPPHLFRFFDRLSESEALERSIAAAEGTFAELGDELAACIVEPLVQGAAGIWTHPESYLRAIERLCRRHGVFLIIDEVATGFGKTGRMFAHEHAGVTPDILVMGKGLSAGYLPLSAVAVTEDLFAGFTAPIEELKTFFYGQTFAGNPLAAAVASANLDLFRKGKVLETTNERIPLFQRMVESRIAPLAHVDEVRIRGLMVGVELTVRPGAREPYPTVDQAGIRIMREARKRGVIVRPIGNVLILMPALAMNLDDLNTLVEVTRESIIAALGE